MTLLNCLNMASRSQALSLSAFCAGILPCAFYMAFDVHNLTNYFLYSAIYTTVINLSIFYVFKQCNFTFEVNYTYYKITIAVHKINTMHLHFECLCLSTTYAIR